MALAAPALAPWVPRVPPAPQTVRQQAAPSQRAIAAGVAVAAAALHQRWRRCRPMRKAVELVQPAPCCDDPNQLCSHHPVGEDLLPVTVLSGFLGAGKTTLLKRILGSSGKELGEACESDQTSPKVAVIVNDMGEVNLDAEEIKNSKLIQEEATMVEMTNGCICCTLRGDLLKTVKSLSEEKEFDYLVIESTGIAEPLPVAQTFVMDVDDLEEGDMEDGEMAEVMEEMDFNPVEAGEMETEPEEYEEYEEGELAELNSLSHFARLDTMVTVVDALNVYDVLGSLETLAEKNIAGMTGNDAEKDDRSIAQLMLDQIEFANVILLSKVHLVKDAKAVQEIRALLQKLNPAAKVIVSSKPHFADVPLSDLINTHLFDMDKAESSAGWMQELAKASEGSGHTPETEEYNISSMVFRNHDRPLHPERLAKVLDGFGSYATGIAAADSPDTSSVFSGVVRAKGHLWVASANARPIDLHVAGRHVQLGASEMPFLAAVPREEWDDAFEQYHGDLVDAGSWHQANGDRGSMVVFIGVGLDKARIEAELATALLTDEEMAKGEDGWKAFEDPFFGGEYFECYQHLEEPKLVILEE